MIINEFSIPAINALKSVDADVIRQITAILMEEIISLRKDVDAMKLSKSESKSYVSQFNNKKAVRI